MKKSRRKNRKLLILILLLAVTLGFALISTTLNVIGTAGIRKNTWDIHWDSESVVVKNGSVSATKPVVSGTNDDTVTFDVDLELPGDYFEFNVDAINEGSVDGEITLSHLGMFDSTGTTELTGDNKPSYLTYSVVYDDNEEEPAIGDVLEKQEGNTPGRRTYRIRVEFNEDETTIPSSTETYKFKYTVVYEPHKDTPSDDEEDGDPTPMDLITRRLCFTGKLPADFWNDFDETTLETTTVDEKTYVNMKSIVKVGQYLYNKGAYTTYIQTGPTIVFPNGIKSIALPNSQLPVDIAGRSGNAVVGYNDKFVKYAYTVRNGKYYEEGYYNEYGDGPLGEMSGYNSVSVDGEGTVYMFATNKVPVTNGNPTYCSAPNGYAITAYLYSTQPFRYSINTSHNDIYPLNSQWDTVGAAKTVNEATNGIYFAKLATYRYDSISCENGSMSGHDYYLQSYHANPMETLLTTVNPAYYHNNNGTTTSTITTEITAEHVKQATETTTSTVEHGGITGITETITCKNVNWSLYEEALYGEFKNQYSDWEHISVGQYDTYYLLG